MNECGNCTLCCKLTEVPELLKPLNQWCKFCDTDKGCSIYSSRPNSCRNFKCIWLVKNLNEKLRPDRCKVIFEFLSSKTFLVIVHPIYSDSWKSGIVLKLINEILQDGISMAVIIPGKNYEILLSKNRLLNDITEELNVALKAHNERMDIWQQHPIQLI